MLGVRVSLAIAAKVEVGADGALVAHTGDVALMLARLGTERPIAENTTVTSLVCRTDSQRKRLIDGDKAVRVLVAGSLNALRAAVEVWASKALVADAVDWLRVCQLCSKHRNHGTTHVVTLVAESCMSGIAVDFGETVNFLVESASSALNSGLEAVARMMTKVILLEARDAEVNVGAVSTGEELLFWKDYGICQL